LGGLVDENNIMLPQSIN